MLNALFGSDLRVKILSFFLLSPEKKANPRQLAVDFVCSVSSVRRELENLVKIGLLKEVTVEKEKNEGKRKKTKKTGEIHYFSAAEDFILYSEARDLFIKAQILPSQKFLNGLRQICQPKLVLLTGAFTNLPEASTDLLIVGSPPRRAFALLIAELEKKLRREINFTILSEKEFYYRREIMDIFLYHILEGKNIILFNNLKK